MFALTLLAAETTFGFESFPEFQWLSKTQASDFDNPEELNAEYSSDFLTYLPPIKHDGRLAKNRQIFDLSAGSLGSKEFMVKDHLKLQHFLIEDQFEFRFHYINERDYEVTVQAQILELILWWQWLGISLFGQTDFEKANDDAGFAILLKPKDEHEIRVWTAFPEFSRNERNNESDKFVDGNGPKAYGLVGRWTPSHDHFLQYSLRMEEKTHWLFPSEGYEYRFSRYHVGLSGQWPLRKSAHSIGFRAQYDRKFESRVETKSIDRKRILTQVEWEFFKGIHLFRPGLAYFYRSYEISDQADRLFRHTLPYMWLRFKERGKDSFRRVWWAGLEATYPEESRPEYRTNLKYEMTFSQRGALSLLFTFDLDDFGTGSTWEGGNAQFYLHF